MTPSAVIFDFDGTITRPYLDFDAIRAEIGIAQGPILEALADWDDTSRRGGFAILERYERRAAEDATLQDGAVETLAELRARGFAIAILTRNARRSVDVVLAKFGMAVDAVRTREDGAIKPSAEPVLSICHELGASPRQSWMVGDHLFDIISGEQAGARTVLMTDGPQHAEDVMRQAREKADHLIHSLPELVELVSGR